MAKKPPFRGPNRTPSYRPAPSSGPAAGFAPEVDGGDNEDRAARGMAPIRPNHLRGQGAGRGARSGPAKSGGHSQHWIYGRHAVSAALANPDRIIQTLFGTRNALASLTETHGDLAAKLGSKIRMVEPDWLDNVLAQGAVHQGLAIDAAGIEQPELDEVLANGPDLLVMLDSVTDPQNIGAIYRSAAAFGAAAIITQDRKGPVQTGALVKAAAGAVEMVADVRVTNLSRALEQAEEAGYISIALAGGTEKSLADCLTIYKGGGHKFLLVLGAEGAGIRPLVQKHCTHVAHIPMHAQMESLNVSVATGIALAFTRECLGGL